MDQNDQRDYAEEEFNRQLLRDEEVDFLAFEYEVGPAPFIAEPNYVEKVFRLLESSNPNDPATELWNDEAIQLLANYLAANDYALGLDEALVDSSNFYAMYDLLKFTTDNK